MTTIDKLMALWAVTITILFFLSPKKKKNKMDLKTAYAVGQNVFLQINDAVAAAVVNEIMPAINASGITINYQVALADGTTQTLPEADVYATAEAVPVPAPQQTEEPAPADEPAATTEVDAAPAAAPGAPYVGMPGIIFIPGSKDVEFTKKMPHPAIVTAVNADGTLNMHVFFDGILGMTFRTKVAQAGGKITAQGTWDYAAPKTNS